MTEQVVPLFPLHTVLFPGGAIPLRIFEPRYLDMISNCMKDNSRFGVAMIQEGNEVGAAAHTYDVGTLVEISYFHMRDDGILGITLQGLEKFHVVETEVTKNQLVMARVAPIPCEPDKELPEKYRFMAQMLRSMIQQLGYPYAKLPADYDNACWVGARLTELLPFPLSQKQYFLQLEDPIKRIEILANLIAELQK